MTSFDPPTVANDVVLVGGTGSVVPGEGPFPVPPGSFVVIEKGSGRVVREWSLDGYFQGGIAAVGEWVLFGTGYNGAKGSMNVWKVG